MSHYTKIGSGIITDVKNRASWYKSDWTDANHAKLKIVAAATFIFLASVLPALAFGEQLAADTNNTLNVVHVLCSTAIGGVTQALLGHPLLIVGVAEPIVLVYHYMFSFAKDKEEIGEELFLAWAAWTCVWAGILVIIFALTNACVYISKFTRYAGEAFGALIALLFLQQAIKGTVNEFNRPEGVQPSQWKIVNGLWAVVLAVGLLLTALTIRGARRWRFLNSPCRSIAADYGAQLLVIVWTGVSYAVSFSDPPNVVPSRVEAPNTWNMMKSSSSWTVASKMTQLDGSYIAAALIPGCIIAVLFFFDHNVSSQLAQQQEFNLRKGGSYHWDMLLLGVLTVVLGVIGLPPVNGVIPQSPMHTKALTTMSATEVEEKKEAEKINGGVYNKTQEEKGTGNTSSLSLSSSFAAAANEAAPPLPHPTIPSSTAIVDTDNNTTTTTNNKTTTASLSVCEQRWSNLFQSLAIGACLVAMPAIRCIPTAVLWGYFAFMAAESLPGSQLWDRTLMLLTDPRRRYLFLEQGHAPYLEIVSFHTVAVFTVVQLAVVGAVYGLTWAGVAGILFPIPIMALVPFRQ